MYGQYLGNINISGLGKNFLLLNTEVLYKDTIKGLRKLKTHLSKRLFKNKDLLPIIYDLI
jgi:hypothetical protein